MRRAPPPPHGDLDDLATLLREEREAVLAGAWDRIGALTPRKSACLATLEAAGGARLAPLAEALARNQALLGAALDGFREASSRRRMMRSARSGLATYDAKGARADVAAVPPRVERKA